MSAGRLSRHPSQSARSQGSRGSGRDAVAAAASVQVLQQPDELALAFKPCDATASFFLHSQDNVIFCLHHDTLAVERRFERHDEDVLIISVDNVSDRAGRFVVSYDASLTAIVWDLFTGDEIARFASYEPIYAATWMRNGTIAFGNAQGSIILFDPNTSEHQAARTIFDPVTALAPAADCKTFAIGYLNGSILIATLQPTFTILHTLNTSRGPSPITGLAWHGSSSKQKTEMLATQTSDGDLRVWSIAKAPSTEQPRIIRILGHSEMASSSKSWFAWSKNGRIVQYTDDGARAWDVRTKKVSSVHVPTVSDVTAVANYGPTASLFTIGPEQSIQQYDLNPNGVPAMVANVQHAPANAPPTPPDSAPRETPPPIEPPTVLMPSDASSEDESAVVSPLRKIEAEMDQIEEEMRDRVGPLSPVSSRASSRASMSSASSYGRKSRRRREHGYSSRTSDVGSEHTNFSTSASSLPAARESVSIRSTSSATSSRYQGSHWRQHTPARLETPEKPATTDLFPHIRARLTEVKFKTPTFTSNRLTPEVLRREMLSVVFGWEEDIEPLIREEMANHRVGSASRVLLGKWLGDDGADQMAEMLGSQSMTSTDWMLLAMTSQMGQGSQKHLGEAFVRRLLATDEVHSAVAILLGLNQPNEAVEAYVSRKFYMEAVLLTCLQFPNDWQRQTYLLRKWGEVAVKNGQAELAVRCFSSTSVDVSEPWFSPRAQDEVAAAQQSLNVASPTSPPSAGPSSRIASKNAGLTKLVTSFDKPPSKSALNTTIGVTPIIDSAVSPGGEKPWKRSGSRGLRDPSSARTATPGGFNRRRGPSVEAGRSALDPEATPLVGHSSRPGSRTSNKDTPATAVKSHYTTAAMPSPAPGVFAGRSPRALSNHREASRDRNRNNLQIQMINTEESDEQAPPTGSTSNRTHKSVPSVVASSRNGDFSPLLTDGSSRSLRGRNIDRYIDSLEAANLEAEARRSENRSRNQSRDGRSQSRARQRAESTGQGDVTYIKSSKRSPSSPAAMNADEALKYKSDRDSSELPSPVESKTSRASASARGSSKARASSRPGKRAESPDDSNRLRSSNKAAAARVASRSRNRLPSPEKHDSSDDRGREHSRNRSGALPSPSSPVPMKDGDDDASDASAAHRHRQRSTSRPNEDRSNTRARSNSRRPTKFTLEEPWSASADGPSVEFPVDEAKSASAARALMRKQLAAKELEERRLSLARREPSVPPVPHPSEYSVNRPSLSLRSISSDTIPPAFGNDPIRRRSRTAEPETMHARTKSGGAAMPTIGLPATPRAMRHPRYMSADPDARDAIPAVPALPDSFQAGAGAQESSAPDGLGPLLPSSTYGQQGGPRSASAPPEQLAGRPRANSTTTMSRGHARRPSQKDVLAEEDAPAVVDHQPAVLPELQHLATPPPPPPPPPPAPPALANSLTLSTDGAQQPGERTSPTSATSRRGRGSISLATTPGGSSSSTGNGLWKNMRERMRSESKGRAKSPPQPGVGGIEVQSFTPSPYETKLPGGWSGVVSPVVAPKSEAPPLPPPPPPPPSMMAQQAADAGTRSPPRGGSMTGYRNPREVGRQFVDGGRF